MKKTKKHKLAVIAGICLMIILITMYFICRPYLFVKFNKKELDIITKEISADNQIEIFKEGKNRYYNNYEAVEKADIDQKLLAACEELMEQSDVSYIGWGCPVNGALCWDQLYLRVYDKNNKLKCFLYCQDESELPEFSDYGPIKCSYITDNWYYLVIEDSRQVKTP